MKKLIAKLLLVVLLFTFTACSSNKGYKDGVYTAESAGFDESGWKDSVTITVKSSRITDVDWNAVNEQGQDKKTLSRNGEYDMMKAGAKSQWHEQAASMEKALVENQSLDKITVNNEGYTDAVSGVTIHVNAFTTLAKEALDKAK